MDETNQITDHLMSGEAWDDFCEALKTAGRVVLEHTPDGNEVDRVEGYRYLLRILGMASGRVVENQPPRARQRIPVIPPPLRGGLGVQSPDQDHVVQPVDPSVRYRVTGRRGTAPYVHMSAWSPPVPDWAGSRSFGPQATELLDEFNPSNSQTPFTAWLDDFTDEDGLVDFVVSVDDPGESNWMPVHPSTRELMMRVVYDDRAQQQKPHLEIEPLESVAVADPPAPATMSRLLSVASQLVVGMQADYSRWTQHLMARENQLQLTDDFYRQVGGSPDDRHFEFGYWRLAEDEALVIEFVPPECEHWNFQLCNHWMENLANYFTGEGYVSSQEAETGPQGVVRLVVGRRPSDAEPWPPAGGNWVNPGDRDHGVMGLRFVKPRTAPEITTRVVPVSELRQAKP